MLKAALNGPWGPARHPRLPVRPEDLGADAARVARLDVGAVHVHPKTDRGEDSLEPRTVAAAVEAVRSQAPGLPVGVTTGAWILPDPAKRVEQVRSWSTLPDFASVNWHEEGATSVAEALLERGVAVEAGLFHHAAATAWAGSGELAEACLRVMIELPDQPWESLEPELARMVALVTERASAPLLVHGEGASCWRALEYAIAQGLDSRIGLEDTTVLPDGRVAADNTELVRAALRISRSGQRRSPASKPRRASST